jgi:hypothetical protein
MGMQRMTDDPDNPDPLDEIEKHQLLTTASRLESEAKHATILTDGFVRTIITLAAAVMTFGVSASSVFKPFRCGLFLAAAWVILLMTVILGLIVQRRCRDLVRISYTKLDVLHKQAIMTCLGNHDGASKLLSEANEYSAQQESEYKKHFFYEKCLIVTFGLGLTLMTVFGILNLPGDSLRPFFQTNRNVSTEWKQLSIYPDGRGYGFAPEVISDVGTNLPHVKALSGKAKFMDEPGRIRLGYVVAVDVDKLDLTKMSEEYRKDKKFKAKTGEEFTIGRSEHVWFQIHFEFTFRDRDNFAIFTIKSSSHDLAAGKNNQFQYISEEPIPQNVAARTGEIMFEMSIDKCVTCE